MSTHTLTRTRAWLVVLVASGCVSAPPSRALQEAQARLEGTRAEQLSAAQPQLIQDARSEAKAAAAAEARGDGEEAELRAQMAIQSYETAASLDGRSAAEARLRAMKRATGELDTEVAQLDRERDALEKFRAAESRFMQVESELAQVRADDQSARANAQRAIITARKKQAEAIGAKAPTAAKARYEQGAAMLVSALAALEAGLAPDAQQLADQAHDQFAQAIVEAGGNQEAMARQGAEAERAATEKQRLASAAKDAIDQAEVARAGAIAGRMPDRDTARFEQGDAYLTMARSRLEGGEFEKATERATQALETFKGSTAAGDAAKAIQAAEDARGLAIGRGLADAAGVRQADYTLGLARQAKRAGDEARAVNLADQARQLYESAMPTAMAVPGMAVGVPGAPMMAMAAAPVDLEGAFQRYEVERALVRIQHERADALADGVDQRCTVLFRGFEAFVQLAKERHAAGNDADAMQYATRASERLRACAKTPTVVAVTSKDKKGKSVTTLVQTQPPIVAGSPVASVLPASALAGAAAAPAAPKETKAEERERQQAEANLALARRFYIRAKARKVPQNAIEEPELLLQEASRWFDRGVFDQADSMAKESLKLLRAAIADAQKAAAAPTPAAPMSGAMAPKPDATAPVAQRPGLLPRKGDPAPIGPPKCPGLNTQLTAARMGRSTAGAKPKSPEEQDRYVRALGMMTSVESLVEAERCAEAGPFLREVNAVFEGIDRGTAVAAVSAVEPNRPEAAACADFDARLQTAYVSQGVASAGVRTRDDRDRFRRAVATLERATRMATDQRCADARATLEQSLLDFEALAPGATIPAEAVAKPTAATLDPNDVASARQSIARAEVLKAQSGAHQSSNVYRTGDGLLTEARKLLQAGRTAEASALAQQAGFAFESLPGVVAEQAGAGRSAADAPMTGSDVRWKGVYQEILDTLVLRDRTHAEVKTDDERARLTDADRFMEKSRQSWAAKNYVAAQRFAQAARADYEAIMAQVDSRKAGRASAADRRQKEAAAVIAARKATAEKAKALEAAQRAQAEMRTATDALRAAEILHARCLEIGCARRDAGAWALAGADLDAARAALDAGTFAETRARSISAEAKLKTLMAKKPEFVVPAGISRVRREGNQLILDPRIAFKSGSTTMVPASIDSVNELGRALLANGSAIQRIEVVGHTDDRGSDKANERLSAERAQAVRKALTDRGVDPALIQADGRGEAEPVADNGTKAGRERNRRVEIRLILNK